MAIARTAAPARLADAIVARVLACRWPISTMRSRGPLARPLRTLVSSSRWTACSVTIVARAAIAGAVRAATES